MYDYNLLEDRDVLCIDQKSFFFYTTVKLFEDSSKNKDVLKF